VASSELKMRHEEAQKAQKKLFTHLAGNQVVNFCPMILVISQTFVNLGHE